MSVLAKEIIIQVRTGDLKSAGTDANVAVKLYDKSGYSTEKITLDNFFKNDFERGNLDVFEIPRDKTSKLGKIQKLEVFRDNSGYGSEWFVERITVENRSTGDVHIFPVFRWLRPHYHYIFNEYDTCLPQDDEHLEQRKMDLEEKKKVYEIDQSDPALPAQVKVLPPDEHFSEKDKWNVDSLKLKLLAKKNINLLITGTWTSVDDMRNIYDDSIFLEPTTSKLWREDWFFGYQRLCGPCPNIIKLCTKISSKFAVKEAELRPFLEGKSLEETMAMKRLFLCDLEILHGLKCKSEEYVVCAPLALLYVNDKNQLTPIAIQLFQEPLSDNPVFFPSDDKWTWDLVKMWYNNAEASFHQSLTHLGYTHLMMEGVCLALHRNVSVSHPIFKLLAPHFLYLMQINKGAVNNLMAKGAGIDKTMSIGSDGFKTLVKKGRKLWRMDVEGTFPENLKARGVFDKDVLPGYHYRDDALLVYNIIEKYVTNYVNLYYDSQSRLQKDVEIQAWAKEVAMSREDGGMGMQGFPGSGEFRELCDLTQALTSIIFTSSVEHAAVNYAQYDHYGFPPLYTPTLRGRPPADKKPRSEADIINSLPDKTTTLDILSVGRVLSIRNQKPLGQFELQYVFDPEAKKIVDQFREDLKNIGKIISQRNSGLDLPYDVLHPDSIPNSISI